MSDNENAAYDEEARTLLAAENGSDEIVVRTHDETLGAAVRFACELLPPEERCDHCGPGDFMGHTCQHRAERIARRWLFLMRSEDQHVH